MPFKKCLTIAKKVMNGKQNNPVFTKYVIIELNKLIAFYKEVEDGKKKAFVYVRTPQISDRTYPDGVYEVKKGELIATSDLSRKDFPELPAFVEEGFFTVRGDILTEYLKPAAMYASNNKHRKQLCGVHYKPETGEVVATDGNVLFYKQTDLLIGKFPSFTLPLKAVSVLTIDKGDFYDISISHESGVVKVCSFSGLMVYFDKLSDFPDYKKMFEVYADKTCSSVLLSNRENLIEFIENYSGRKKPKKDVYIWIAIYQKHYELRAISCNLQDGRYEEEGISVAIERCETGEHLPDFSNNITMVMPVVITKDDPLVKKIGEYADIFAFLPEKLLTALKAAPNEQSIVRLYFVKSGPLVIKFD
jgi:hypothetical protein